MLFDGRIHSPEGGIRGVCEGLASGPGRGRGGGPEDFVPMTQWPERILAAGSPFAPPKAGRRGNQRGLTLVEIIVGLILASVLGSMLVSLMGTSLTGSVQPLLRVRDSNTLNQCMEKMTADYRLLTATEANFLAVFQSHVQNGNSEAASPYFGPYTLVTNSFISFDAGGNETPGGDKILKVTISMGNERVTALFTK